MASPSSFSNPFDPQARFVLPTPQMRLRPAPPRLRLELAWLTWQMPAELRDNTLFNLRQTLDWRAQYCQPLDAPEQPVGQTRFGALGEALWPQDTPSVCDTLRAELRETLRTVESTQPRLERNRRLAMHSARLGQLACELEQRGQETLEEIRGGLEVLWV